MGTEEGIKKLISQFESKIVQKLCKMQEQAIIELIGLTGFNVHAFNLKQIEGARHAIEAIKEKGYIISQIETDSALEVLYILQRHGKIIAQRDVSVKIKISNKAEDNGEKSQWALAI